MRPDWQDEALGGGWRRANRHQQKHVAAMGLPLCAAGGTGACRLGAPRRCAVAIAAMPHLLLPTMWSGSGWRFGSITWLSGLEGSIFGLKGPGTVPDSVPIGRGKPAAHPTSCCPSPFLLPVCQPLPSHPLGHTWSPGALPPPLGLRPRHGACGNQTD